MSIVTPTKTSGIKTGKMKEIKLNSAPLTFRAWDKHEGKWLFGYESPNLGGFAQIGETVLFGELSKFNLSYYENIIFTQSTGKEDKNGKLIYQGDIVTARVPNYDYDEIDNPNADRYKDIFSYIDYRNHGFWVDSESFGYEGESLWDWNNMEVVGNVFESKHLIPLINS